MGAQTSRDGRSQEDASASASASAQELGAEVKSIQEENSVVDSKPLQKNGQISSMTSLNGHSEDNTLAEVGQPDGVSVAPKEEAPETMDTTQEEVTPQVNGEKVEKESPDAIDISTVEEKTEEEKPQMTSAEVGFKKIFRFVGFKFTLKKDKGDEKEPVKLITVKDKEGEEVSEAETAKNAKEAAPIAEVSVEKKPDEIETSTTEASKETSSTTEAAKETSSTTEAAKETSTSEDVKETSTTEDAKETSTTEAAIETSTTEAAKETPTTEPEKESSTTEPEKESSTTEAAEETSTTEATEEASTTEAEKEASTTEAAKEASTTEAPKDTDEAVDTKVPPEAIVAEAVDDKTKEEGGEKEPETSPPPPDVSQSTFRKFFTAALFSNLRKKASIKKTKEEEQKEEQKPAVEETTKAEETTDAVKEEEEKVEGEQEAKEEPPAVTPEETKQELSSEPEAAVETPAPEAVTADETKPEEEGEEVTVEEEKPSATEVSSEVELLSSQEKAKAQGSPLKKLFTGAGLKKLSTKKQKNKKDGEAKLTESGEQASEHLQSSTESTEVPKGLVPDNKASSPEVSGEQVIAVEVTQPEPSPEPEPEVTSDGEKKREGLIGWSSFKKLVSPRRHVKKPSESEDEATGDKPVKSATLSSTESAVFAEKCSEEEAKEEKLTEEEPKTENTDKLASSTEESKKKLDTSVSWEALMCMGGTKKRTRRTSDSDDEETKVDDNVAPEEAEQEANTMEPPVVIISQETETEGEVVSSPEPLSSPPERESAWDTLKRLVMLKNKAKAEEKTEESSDQVLSDSEAPKEESSFSLRKFFPGRRKKKIEKPASPEVGLGEEDSDTPAVVPLSEYDVEQVETEPEQPEVPPVQTTVSAEDRTPSWIPAIVEDVSDQHDQLSDITEEAENAATPKSADTTIAEDEIEDQPTLSPGVLDKGRRGRRLSTAEVKPVVPAPSAETTPVPQGSHSESTEMVQEGMVEQVSEIPCQTSVTVQDVPTEAAAAVTEYEPQTEHAETKVNIILEPHAGNEAVAICTGLGTKEIAKLALEKPVMPTSECMAVISDALCAEVVVEEKPSNVEEAIVTEDPILEAQVNQVETIDLEPAVKSLVTEVPVVQTASRDHEPNIEMLTVVSSFLEESEMVQPVEVEANSPKSLLMTPIAPTVEAAIYTESAEVTQPAVEIKENEMSMEQRLLATENNTGLQEMAQAVSQEITSTMCNPVVPADEVAIVKETMILVTSHTESQNVNVETIQLQPTIQGAVAGAVVQEESKKMDVKREVEQVNAIEEQSMVIAQSVIQTAVNKMSETKPEPKRPTTPTTSIPEPVHAVANKEKEIEIETEKPVITEVPVVVMCEAPPPKSPKSPRTLHAAIQVIDTFPVEFIETLDAPGEREKPKKELKQAAEVTASEDVVMVEEVVEMIKSQTDGELEDVKKEQSKDEAVTQEVVPAQVKEATDSCDEEKPQSEAHTEEKKDQMIHMPVQVVLQMAQMIEDPSVEEEAVEEFDSNGPVKRIAPPKSPERGSSPTRPVSDSLPTLFEEPQTLTSEGAAPSPRGSPVVARAASPAQTDKSASGKCAEVMAQVIEVIEEAVKEIEPVSTQISAAS